MRRRGEHRYPRLALPLRLRRLASGAGFLLVAATAGAAAAGNICNETVPSNRMVDGFPAYSQCADSTNSSIYSNNGIDTATTSGGNGWVRTQGSGGYQCTEWAHRYLTFRWNVTSVPSGNAGVWCDGNIPSGLVKTTVPVHGDIMVFAPGSCGADATTGHVAVVDVVNSNGTVTFVEQNRANRRSCATDTAACFLHATANDGSSIDGGSPDGTVDAAPAPDASTGLDARPDRFRDSPAGAGGTTGTGAGGAGGAPGTGGQTSVGGSTGTGGALASGGQAGGAGAIGAGGSNAGGGVPGAGGRAGLGGTTTDGTGSGGAGGTTSTEPTSSAANGCTCRLSAPGGSGGQWLLAALAWLVLAGLRRPTPHRRHRR
jgi:surface antigen